jgi:AcrR family transcriptional regulator
VPHDTTPVPAAPLPGRQAEAARNDQLILHAARAVFVADPSAPVSEVAKRAGVGIGALYRRFPSKEDMLRKLSGDGLHRYIAEAEQALADDRDPWTVFAAFLTRVVAADTHSLTQRLAGTFRPTDELYRDAARAQDLNVALFGRVRAAGAIRPGVVVDDIAWILEMVASVRLRDSRRTSELRDRYLALLLEGLRAPGRAKARSSGHGRAPAGARARSGTPASQDAAIPLPGPPPTWEEIGERWNT